LARAHPRWRHLRGGCVHPRPGGRGLARPAGAGGPAPSRADHERGERGAGSPRRRAGRAARLPARPGGRQCEPPGAGARGPGRCIGAGPRARPRGRAAAAARGAGRGRRPARADPCVARRPPFPGRTPAARAAACPGGGEGSRAGPPPGRWLAGPLNAPPQTPVVLAVDVRRRELLDVPGLTPAATGARERFFKNARNEERFAAEYALLLADDPTAAPTLSRSALAAAVALRAYAQEEVWFPGFGGPTTRELEERFGLAAVRFDPDVPSSWRPYFRRMLAQSLADLQRVLPALDTRGLRVHFGKSPGRDATLALH